MKPKLLLLFLFLTIASKAQIINLTKNTFTTYDGGPGEIYADSALMVANAVLNSLDFRDSLTIVSFKNKRNNCGCNPNIILINKTAFGKDAYAELF